MGSQTSLLGIMNYFHLNLHACQVIVTVGDSGLCCFMLVLCIRGLFNSLVSCNKL